MDLSHHRYILSHRFPVRLSLHFLEDLGAVVDAGLCQIESIYGE